MKWSLEKTTPTVCYFRDDRQRPVAVWRSRDRIEAYYTGNLTKILRASQKQLEEIHDSAMAFVALTGSCAGFPVIELDNLTEGED